MAGIICIISGNHSDNNKTLLTEMSLALKHRDWYKIDSFVEGQIAMARVSLGKFNPEPQPIFNEDKSLCILMEGEVYDYEDIKRDLIDKNHKFTVNNDPEFVLHLYEEYGKDFAKKLNGSFVAVILNRKKQEIIVANDRFGLRPIFYAKYGDKIVLASETKAIINDKDFKREVDDEAVADYFSFGYSMSDKTLLKGVKFLDSGIVMRIDKDLNTSQEKYWDFEFTNPLTETEEEILKKLGELFRTAVKRQLKGNHRIAIPLSGGFDSRIIAASVSLYINNALTFTFGRQNCYDLKFAKEISKRLGFKNQISELKPDYLVDLLEKNVYFAEGRFQAFRSMRLTLTPLIKENCDVILNGHFGATLLEGYLIYNNFSTDIHSPEFTDLFFKKLSWISEEEKEKLFTANYYNKIKNKSKKSFLESWNLVAGETVAQVAQFHNLKNRQRKYIANFLPFDNLDTEYRVPFADNDYIEYAIRIPKELEYDENACVKHKKVYIEFIKKEFPEMAKIGWTETGLPITTDRKTFEIHIFIRRLKGLFNKLMKKSKIGIKFDNPKNYEDHNNWMRENSKLKNCIQSIILDDRTFKRGYFKEEYLKEILDAHMNKGIDKTVIISLIVTFELWHRQFIDENN